MDKKSRLLQGLSLLGLTLTLTAQDPWAVEVMSYVPGSAAAVGYTTPDAALGRPGVDTYADTVEASPSVTVVPVYPVWDPSELISIGEGGSLVLRMGSAITDDPAHPYGVDFLVFTNGFINGAGSYDQSAQNPGLYTLAGASEIGLSNEGKAAQVSLSADGITWFSFPAQKDLMRLLPTLGRVWTGSAWGDPTHPTLPPDPEITLADLAGLNLAELCRRYRGGAGGSGFDLADLIDPGTGTVPSSFTYVKISVADDGNAATNLRVEIDAVTVTSPVEAYTRWTQEKFDWLEDPALESPASNPDGDPFDNWQEFARDGDPRNGETTLWLPQVSLSKNQLSYTLPSGVKDAPWIIQTSTAWDEGFSWQDLEPRPSPEDIPSGENLDRTIPLAEPTGNGVRFFRLKLEDPS